MFAPEKATKFDGNRSDSYRPHFPFFSFNADLIQVFKFFKMFPRSTNRGDFEERVICVLGVLDAKHENRSSGCRKLQTSVSHTSGMCRNSVGLCDTLTYPSSFTATTFPITGAKKLHVCQSSVGKLVKRNFRSSPQTRLRKMSEHAFQGELLEISFTREQA